MADPAKPPPMDREAAQMGAAMMEMAIDLCRSGTEISECLSVNRRLVNEIGHYHPDLLARLKARTISKRQSVQ